MQQQGTQHFYTYDNVQLRRVHSCLSEYEDICEHISRHEYRIIYIYIYTYINIIYVQMHVYIHICIYTYMYK